jgi:Asp-tRNA(Asn)/Glu-tRNA(Gln) amidotransferase A subunit family amidase
MTATDRRRFLAQVAASGVSIPFARAAAGAQILPGTTPVDVDTIKAAARLAGLTWTDDECAELTDALSRMIRGAEGIERRTLTNASPLPLQFNPRPPGAPIDVSSSGFHVADPPRPPRPSSVEALAFATIPELAAQLRARQVTSVNLTRMYLDRMKRANATLNCVASLTEARALAEAESADREIAGGNSRGLLHGIPYGVKDIIAASGAPTEWGAAPTKGQTFNDDATVVARLRDSGAVLVAKLTTGEMAFGDQWAGGRTNNPWNPRQGSSGSSAGPGAATAAGLVGFSIGTDTGGSILSPSARCGVVGLRPTFGRVSRHGVMTAGSTLDKIGPMCRTVEDCAIVLHTIAGPDGQDLAVPERMSFGWDGTSPEYPRRIGYVPSMFEAESDPDARANNERALATLRRMGCTLEEVTLPPGDLSYFIEYIERAAAFDSFTNAGQHKGLQQRTSRFLRACQLVTAVDYLQANRRRLAIMSQVDDVMRRVEALVFTSLTLDSRTSLNPVLSLTGHPAIAVPNGFDSSGAPASVMFSGRLYREDSLLSLARAYERTIGRKVAQPPLFAVANA